MITISKELNEKDIVAQTESRIGNGQRNILIITVDQLDLYEPVLKGVWLLITYPEIPNLTLVPVYPDVKIDSSSGELPWIKLFSMAENQIPNEEFLNALHEQFLWQNYLIIDAKGASAVQKILQQYSEKFHSGEIHSDQNILPASNSDIGISLEKQIKEWNTVCHEITSITDLSKIDELLLQISPYIHTNINWDDIVQQWALASHEDFHLGCEFPTLALNNP